MNRIPAFVIGYSDSSFTNPHEVARPDDPPECTGNFTHMGAKYWGFETRRHIATRIESAGYRFDHDAHHWIELGFFETSFIEKITISTKWFTGNQVPEISVLFERGDSRMEVITRTKLEPDADHELTIPKTEADRCLIRCYHEGGIARINFFGESAGQSDQRENLLESATISHVSNEHYGKPSDAVAGNREVDYMFGWESARTGFGESALFHLTVPTVIDEVIVDTYMHRLNPPLGCHIFALSSPDDVETAYAKRPKYSVRFDDGSQIVPEDFKEYMSSKQYLKERVKNPGAFSIHLVNEFDTVWFPIVSFGQLSPDTWHRFTEIEHRDPVTHLLYMHYPNGGIHGLKVFGHYLS